MLMMPFRIQIAAEIKVSLSNVLFTSHFLNNPPPVVLNGRVISGRGAE
ncbi:hypothetical protein DDI_0128 [Dickeya dianthicola RNS04.9]|nr:hypothetical protein DDI_0128 [Dickeya dianthicola RNS04.9]